MSDLANSLYQNYSGDYSGSNGQSLSSLFGGTSKKKKKDGSNVLKDSFYEALGFDAGTDPGESIRNSVYSAMGFELPAATAETEDEASTRANRVAAIKAMLGME